MKLTFSETASQVKRILDADREAVAEMSVMGAPSECGILITRSTVRQIGAVLDGAGMGQLLFNMELVARTSARYAYFSGLELTFPPTGEFEAVIANQRVVDPQTGEVVLDRNEVVESQADAYELADRLAFLGVMPMTVLESHWWHCRDDMLADVELHEYWRFPRLAC